MRAYSRPAGSPLISVTMRFVTSASVTTIFWCEASKCSVLNRRNGSVLSIRVKAAQFVRESIQELQARIASAESELSFALGRSPRPSEIASHLNEDIEEVTEALATDGCFTPASLDKPVGTEGETALGELIGSEDEAQSAAEARIVLAPVVRRLSERDRRILMLRFFRGWTQQEIADDIGVTQMQVSRLLSRILTELREQIDDPPSE